MYVCTYVSCSMYLCMHVCISVSIYVCKSMYVCRYIYMHVRAYVWIFRIYVCK